MPKLPRKREDYVPTLADGLETPLLDASRSMKLLLDGSLGPVSQQQAQMLQTLIDSNERSYKLVHMLLDIYCYENGVKQLKLSHHDLAVNIANVLRELRSIAYSKGIFLDCLIPAKSLPVFCDIEEIKTVVRHLVDNALKFTPPKGIVVVSVEHARSTTTVTVSDSGEGIADHQKPYLFERLGQPGTNGKYANRLGLYLCRRIIEMHKGKIWCESQKGNGSTFYFSLPTDPKKKA